MCPGIRRGQLAHPAPPATLVGGHLVRIIQRSMSYCDQLAPRRDPPRVNWVHITDGQLVRPVAMPVASPDPDRSTGSAESLWPRLDRGQLVRSVGPLRKSRGPIRSTGSAEAHGRQRQLAPFRRSPTESLEPISSPVEVNWSTRSLVKAHGPRPQTSLPLSLAPPDPSRSCPRTARTKRPGRAYGENRPRSGLRSVARKN